MSTSGAVMMHDLARQFVKQGHQATVVIPFAGLNCAIDLQHQAGCKVVYVRVLPTKDVNHILRAWAEWLNPYLIWFRLRRYTPFTLNPFDGVVWYSPSIFWAPLIKRVRQFFQCPSYLILRDMFPDWALDLEILKPGLQYRLLKWVQESQYAQADTIGVQSPNNLSAFIVQNPGLKNRSEVLWNWGSPEMDPPQLERQAHQVQQAKQDKEAHPACSIDLSKSSLSGRTLFVYAGNMGLAQDVDVLVDLANALNQRTDIGFILVGRGSEVPRLRARITNEQLSNIQIYDEIAADEIKGLYAQCHVGIVSLDLRHTTHNIPGKLVSYMQAGIPVLAIVNPGNDLLALIRTHQLGVACDTHALQEICAGVDKLVSLCKTPAAIQQRCQAFFAHYFSVETAAKQILRQLQNTKDEHLR